VITPLLDEYQMADDPQLAPLKAAYLSEFSEKEKKRKAKDFGRELFFSKKDDLFIPSREFRDSSTSKRYFYLKTAEEASVVPKSLEEVRAEAERQWKLEKARKLARKEAKKIAADLAKSGDDLRRKLLDYKEKLGQKELIVLPAVAPLVKADEPMAMRLVNRYKKYKVPEDLFQYPRVEEWTKKILKMEKPGEAVQILDNQPELIFYVAARVSEPKASEMDFRDVYQKDNDPLRNMCLRHFAQEHKVQVVKYLKERYKFKDLRTRESKDKDKDEGPDLFDTEGPLGID
jgi:hypothetical protein